MKPVVIIAVFVLVLLTTTFTLGYAALVSTIGGTQGTGNGEFDQPWGLGIGSSGTIYVAEYWNHRIQEFDATSDHSFSAQIVDPGVRGYDCTNNPTDCDGNGELNQPMDVDVDSSGNLWVVDLGNNRIQKFNGSSGTYVSQFGSFCDVDSNTSGCNASASGASVTGDGQFYSPKSIAIDSSDNIWVADTNNNRIQKFNSAGVFQMKFGSEGCQVIQNDGTITGELHNGKFCNPQALDFDSSGNLYVVDHNNRRIQQFDSSGTYLDSFGSYGTTDGKFLNPHFITIDRFDHIYVTDRERNNIQVFDDSFNFRYSITGLSDPKDVVVDSLDRLLVAYNHGVNVYTATTGTWGASTTSLDFSTFYDVEITTMANSLTKITIPSSNQAAALAFSGTALVTSGSDKSITFQNPLEIIASTTSGTINVEIPSGTSMTGTSWDGNFKMAGFSDASSITVSGQTIESSKIFGSDDVNLSFSDPVKMTFVGKSDKNIGVKTVGGSATLISTVCSADSSTSVASQLGGSGECKIVSGSNLITYTYHFTTFFTSSDTPSTSTSSGGGGKGSCDSNGFGNGQSLRVYQISYDTLTHEVQVHAYSTCGSIQTKMTTPMQQSILGLSTDQPLLDDRIVVYSGFLDESDEKFNISIQNKRDSFSETFYIYDKSITKKYSGDTGYTSEQQGTSLPTVTSKQTTVVSEPSVTQIVQTIKDPITIESKKQIPDEKSDILQSQSIGYTPEPVAEKEIKPQCGVGTKLVDGICKIIKPDEPKFCFLFWCW